MFDYLVDHALKNVWCAPGQDMQAIVKPARLTSATGAFSTFEVMWRKVTLPVRGVRFHVYQIGQLHPLLMGLFPVQSKWMSLAETCQLQNIITSVYSSAGVELPRCETWYMVTENKNLILAIRDQPKIKIKLGEEDIYFRVYTNAYYNSIRANSATDTVFAFGKTVLTTADILSVQNSLNTYKLLPGAVTAYVNGEIVSEISLLTARTGDIVEFVHDSSVVRVAEFRVGDLPNFVSELDGKHKYLIHCSDPSIGTIQYHDDVDFQLIRYGQGGRYSGLYYHRNMPDSVRMVTHKDYSMPVAYVAGYVETQPNWTDIDNLYVRVLIRNSGFDRPLVFEHSRVSELYKLPDADVLRAMVGVNAVVPYWTASALEASTYTALMSEPDGSVTHELVQDAYGYNAISKLTCDTPKLTTYYSGQYRTEVPYGLQARSIAYEYDSDGLLLGSHSHVAGSVYVARNLRTRLVEMLAGQTGTRLDETYGQHTQMLDPMLNYRMYVCPIESGYLTNVWTDVTDSGQYAMTGNLLTWLVDPTRWYTMVRSDATFLSYDLSLHMNDGLLKYSLASRQLRNGVLSSFTMQVPMGELEIFLNGHSLIEGIDYFVHFPQIVIVNKEYLVDPENQEQSIHTRFCGFCTNDLKHEPPQDVGYVDYNLLSHNDRYDIREDKVMRVVVHGKVYDRSELQFAETDAGVGVPHERNGAPYMLRDIVTPLRGLTKENTYSLRSKSRVIDKIVSDYMTLKLPQRVQTTPSAISTLYQLVSPFLCKILHDLESGALQDERLKFHYNDELVMELCEPYLYLLKFDPTQLDTHVDPAYTIVHVHHLNQVKAIDIYTYKFVASVNRVFLNNKVHMSHIVNLAPVV